MYGLIIICYVVQRRTVPLAPARIRGCAKLPQCDMVPTLFLVDPGMVSGVAMCGGSARIFTTLWSLVIIDQDVGILRRNELKTNFLRFVELGLALQL